MSVALIVNKGMAGTEDNLPDKEPSNIPGEKMEEHQDKAEFNELSKMRWIRTSVESWLPTTEFKLCQLHKNLIRYMPTVHTDSG